MSIMQKKDPKAITIYAQDFLKSFRNKNKNQPASQMVQQNNNQQVIQNNLVNNNNEDNDEIQMRSESAFQAEQLFGNLIPQHNDQDQIKHKKQISSKKIVIQKSKSKAKTQSTKQQKPLKTSKASKQPQIIQKPANKTKNIVIVNPQNQQIKVNQTRSILLKGRLTAQRKDSGMDEQQIFQEQKKQIQPPKQNRRKVTFQGLLPITTEIQKKWNDPIQNQKKGKFDKQEERILSEAVGKFLVSNDISLQQFQSLLSVGQKSQKFTRKQKVFALLSTALPNRSPQSCYKYLKRNFNSLNRKGKWTQQQIDKLKFLVEKYGRKWTMISKELKRTADNCYDKYRQLGQQNMDQRIKGIWKFRELVQLLNLIQKMTKTNFLNTKLNEELSRQDFHDQKQKEQVTNRKYNSKNFIFHTINIIKPYINAKNFQKIDISQIRWNEIANKLKTRNILACRNKIIQLLQIFFYSSSKQLDEEIVQFLILKKYQHEQQINWKDWKHKNISADQAKNRYMILKKIVQGRSVKPFKTIVLELKERVTKKNSINAQSKNKTK